MVPGQHHVRMNMYIARASDGAFKVVKSLGAVDPHERVHVETTQDPDAGKPLERRLPGRGGDGGN